MTSLRTAAVEVLSTNWTGTATLPSPSQYPHQWSWDSAFISIGWARCDPARARQELASLFAGQWGSGRLPHIVFNPATDRGAYFPGPDFWNSEALPDAPPAATSGIVQPPVHARAVLTTWQADPDSAAGRAFLASLYPRLAAWHGYLHRYRDVGRGGLAAIVHPWESGLDNSPAWDHALAGVAGEHHHIARRDLVHVGADQRPTDAEYRAYVTLAQRYRDTGYADGRLDSHPFLVEDPLFNAVFLDAELCCAQLAEALGHDPTPHRQAAHALHDALVRRLWDPRAGRFRARDVRTGRMPHEATIGCLVPLLDPWLPTPIADAVVALAESTDFADGCRYPMPSTPLGSAHFDHRRYWRGPTWINTNWLLWHAARRAGRRALADRLAESSLALVSEHGFHEYFDPHTGEGLGAPNFSWTAALTLDFLTPT